jgi:uncharacterized membrane protein
VPSAEVGVDALIAIVILALLAIQRRHRIRGETEPIAVSLATGAVLGLATFFAAAVVISWVVTSA